MEIHDGSETNGSENILDALQKCNNGGTFLSLPGKRG